MRRESPFVQANVQAKGRPYHQFVLHDSLQGKIVELLLQYRVLHRRIVKVWFRIDIVGGVGSKSPPTKSGKIVDSADEASCICQYVQYIHLRDA